MSHRWHDPGHSIQSRTEVATEPTHPAQPNLDAGTEMGHGHGRSYDIYATVFFGGRRNRVFNRLAAQSGARSGDRVLDVGCGTGYFTRLMAQAVAPGGTAHGVDPSGDAIREARRVTRFDTCTFSEGVAEALDAPDGAYDVVVSSWMYRVLRPGGTVLISEFRPPASRTGRRLITKFTGHDAMANNRVDLLDPMIRKAGFEQPHSGELRPWTYYIHARKPINTA
jgi:ubiquinone/menaquinone biosynthesis C-methylase UbiE